VRRLERFPAICRSAAKHAIAVGFPSPAPHTTMGQLSESLPDRSQWIMQPEEILYAQ